MFRLCANAKIDLKVTDKKKEIGDKMLGMKLGKFVCGNFPLQLILGGPKHTGNEPKFLLDFEDPLRFVELTAYPQRSALEPLLTID